MAKRQVHITTRGTRQVGQLIQRCVSGDQQGWQAFVEEYAGVIYSAAYRTIHRYIRRPQQEMIEDAVQEAFLRLVKNNYALLRSYDPSRASMITWLLVVVRSASIDLLRRSRTAELPWDTQDVDIRADETGRTDTPIDIPKDILTSRQALILHLLFDDDMDVSEVAALLNVKDQTIRSAKHKALVRLRRHFGVAE